MSFDFGLVFVAELIFQLIRDHDVMEDGSLYSVRFFWFVYHFCVLHVLAKEFIYWHALPLSNSTDISSTAISHQLRSFMISETFLTFVKISPDLQATLPPFPKKTILAPTEQVKRERTKMFDIFLKAMASNPDFNSMLSNFLQLPVRNKETSRLT